MLDAVSERDVWNAARYAPGQPIGHYESYFQRANHPRRPLAFWIRYTAFSPKGLPQEAVGELWAIWFDGESDRVTAVKQAVPMAGCQFSRSSLDVHIGDAVLDPSHLAGHAASNGHSVRWDLRYEGNQPPLLLLPPSFYGRGLPKAKALVGTPNAAFHGVLSVDGETVDVDGWTGSQNHNWGQKHTDSYAWGQVAGFDDAPDVFLECSTARLRVGPFWTPRLTLLVLRLEDREIRMNTIGQALRAKGTFDWSSWRIESGNSEARVYAHVHAPRSAFVGLTYANPPGGTKTCLNTKLAACELAVELAGRPKRTLTTRSRAAFEILTDRTDHGVPIVV